uniref:Uncharacterized protein n=1 Tax=Cyclopterus lumpus TaxID=8103 RepID=A0A8C3B421_CYCLU
MVIQFQSVLVHPLVAIPVSYNFIAAHCSLMTKEGTIKYPKLTGALNGHGSVSALATASSDNYHVGCGKSWRCGGFLRTPSGVFCKFGTIRPM